MGRGGVRDAGGGDDAGGACGGVEGYFAGWVWCGGRKAAGGGGGLCEFSGGCNADAVGDDVRVGDVAKGGFEEHWDWLRGALKDAKTAKDGERAKLMREAGARLEAMGQESAGGAAESGFARARAVANAVLAEPQFQGAVGLTWWDRAKMKIF